MDFHEAREIQKASLEHERRNFGPMNKWRTTKERESWPAKQYTPPNHCPVFALLLWKRVAPIDYDVPLSVMWAQ